VQQLRHLRVADHGRGAREERGPRINSLGNGTATGNATGNATVASTGNATVATTTTAPA